MLDPNIQPVIVVCDEEIRELKNHLVKVRKSQVSTVFIPRKSREGDTRLVHRIKGIAPTRGFNILKGGHLDN
jgi:hypothetical protein